jgi:hypothetical protein
VIRTEFVRRYRPGPEVWRDIFVKNGVDGVACANYEPHKHGSPSANKPDNYHTYNLDITLADRNYFMEPGKILAVSLLVSTASAEYMAGGYPEPWIENPGPDYWTYAVPQAILGADFDCPCNLENALLISKKLSRIAGNWSLLDTGGSYHWIHHNLVSPRKIPFHFGALLTRFSNEIDEASGDFFNKAGSRLQRNGNDPKAVKNICDEILDNAWHWGEGNPDKPFFTFPDARWMAHSLHELVRFFENKKSGFGFLRIGPKEPRGQIPTLKAEKKNGEVVVYEVA